MKIRKNTVVSAQYKLTADGAAPVIGSDEEGPMVYLHGHQQILEALEAALEGAESGETRHVTLSPDEGFGERDPRLVFNAPRANLPEGPLETGMVLQTTEHQGDGRHFPLRIVELTEQQAVLDGNHPLAGRTLHFEVTITGVRPASLQEVRDRKITEN